MNHTNSTLSSNSSSINNFFPQRNKYVRLSNYVQKSKHVLFRVVVHVCVRVYVDMFRNN
jgi:hypothetical protein